MSRFARAEPVAGSDRVFLVWDEAHAVYRAQRIVEDPDPGLVARIRAVSQVRHPNLVMLVAVAEDPRHARIVTEWVPGGPVRDLPALEAIRALQAACHALEALHEVGLAHGGPLRLLFDGVGRARLYRAGVVPGTPAEDLRSMAALIRVVGGVGIPLALEHVAERARDGRFTEAADLRAALKDARSAVAAATAAPVARADHADDDEQMRLGWLAVALVPALLLVLGAAVLGWWRGVAG